MLFEWDDEKAANNKRKHKISFDLATFAFDDPAQFNDFDRTVRDEDRYFTLGTVNQLVLFVSHCYRKNENGETVIRIISARKATRKEKAAYDSGTLERNIRS
jgi:uncharacterized DUF497 family protein